MIRGIVEVVCHNVARGRYEEKAQRCGGVRYQDGIHARIIIYTI